MHRDLEKWLSDTWNGREKIFEGLSKNGRAILAQPIGKHQGIQKVYSLYTAGGEDVVVTGGDGDLPAALRELAKLVNAKQANCVIQSEGWIDASVEDLMELAGGSTLTFQITDEEGELKLVQISPDTLDWDFIHVRHPIKFPSGGTDQRIYLNLSLMGRGSSFREIVELVYDHPGFRSAKVMLTDGDPRNDTALLYLAGEVAVKYAIGVLTNYQKVHKGAFRPALPRLTAPEAGLVGVGRGMEPPDFAVIRRGGKYYKKTAAMSFGWWRAALIFMALDRTKWDRSGQGEAERLKAFKRRAEKYFVAAGIDPDNPSVQKNPTTLSEYVG